MVKNQQRTREGWSAFYRNLEKLAVGAVRADRSDRYEDSKLARTWPVQGQTNPVEYKFQWSYCSPDMSGQGLDMLRKPLWNSVKGSDKSGGLDLFGNRSNWSNRYAKMV
jgi:hypothetical protein